MRLLKMKTLYLDKLIVKDLGEYVSILGPVTDANIMQLINWLNLWKIEQTLKEGE
jgi:hypothetical protein